MKRDKIRLNLDTKYANELLQIHKNYAAQTSSNLTLQSKSVNSQTGAKFC
nr:hypothetical protein [uncultured Campylobacter sp.]